MRAGRLNENSSDCSIRVRNLRKTYQTGKSRVEALRGLNMEITEPGFYAIMGPSGSGKSTLLHLLSALDRADDSAESDIIVAGARLQGMSERELTLFRRRRIGIVFQQFNLISTLSALDNVTLPAMLDGRSSAWRKERGESLLASLGLSHRAHHRPDALSGGEQQRVAIARALLFSPSILFADEPTGNLDSATSAKMWSLLRELAEERRMTVLMVTHEPSAAEHCRRVFMLRDGLIERMMDTTPHAPESAPRAEQLIR